MHSAQGGHRAPPNRFNHPSQQSPASPMEIPMLEDLFSNEEKTLLTKLKIQKNLDIPEAKSLLNTANLIRNSNPLLRQNISLIHKLRSIIYKISAYEEDAFPPFLVIAQHNDQSRNIHPMNVAKLLFQNNVEDLKEVQPKGRNKVGISFKTPLGANNFIKTNPMAKESYNAYIPQSMLYCRGIIRNVGDTITEEDLIHYGIGTRGSKSIKIVDATRFNRRITENGVTRIVPSNTFLLQFAGKNLPVEIELFNTKSKVLPYIRPVILCVKCYKYGHHKNQCKNKEACQDCLKIHDNDTCERVNDTYPKNCPNCDEQHEPSSRNCKEYIRQHNINKAIAEYNISLFEANKLFPRNNKENSNYQVQLQDFPNTLQAACSPQMDVSKNTRKMTETYASQTKKKPRIVSQGYDKAAHLQNLLPNTTRIASQSSSPVHQKTSTPILQKTSTPVIKKTSTTELPLKEIKPSNNDLERINNDISMSDVSADIIQEVIIGSQPECLAGNGNLTPSFTATQSSSQHVNDPSQDRICASFNFAQ